MLLGVLHLVQPELTPATSVVSQYALGTGGWMMAAVFLLLADASVAAALAATVLPRRRRTAVGRVLLLAAAVGLLLAAAFPVGEPMHEVASMIGNLALPIGALLVGLAVPGARLLSQLPWIGVVCMMTALFTAPEILGWVNRAVVLAYLVWLAIVPWRIARVARGASPAEDVRVR